MTAGPELTDSQRRAGLGISILCIAVAALAIGLTFPLLALLLEGKGFSGTAIGINSAMGPLAILLSSAFVPRWIARFGAKRFIVMCVLVSAVPVEPVSCFLPLIYREFTGNIVDSGPDQPIRGDQQPSVSAGSRTKFPVHRNREFAELRQGIFVGFQGSCGRFAG